VQVLAHRRANSLVLETRMAGLPMQSERHRQLHRGCQCQLLRRLAGLHESVTVNSPGIRRQSQIEGQIRKNLLRRR
jgi:hypothetical protein